MSGPKGLGVKFDSEKRRMELIPPSLLRGLAEVLTFGAKKYTDRNWEKGIQWSRCYGAALRHLTDWWDRKDIDPETGLSHLKHAATNLAFLIEYEETHRELDDRPNAPQSEDPAQYSIFDPTPPPTDGRRRVEVGLD